MSKFNIGDRVVAYFDDYGKGTIVDIDEYNNYAISFDEEIINGWGDEEYNITNGHGWWLSEDDLELINKGENTMSKTKIRGFKIVSDNHRKSQEEITLPTRGTSKSAGYDFYSPIDIEIQPNQKVCIWSDVKAYMQEGEVLLLFVRSSIGIKRGLRLSNSTGVIDSDYFSNEDNDGNIGIALHNYTDNVVTIEKGERVCQGVFIPFLVADNGNTDIERNGGIGSTN